MRTWWRFAVLAALAAASGMAAANAEVYVTGRVLLKPTGTPLRGIHVSLYGPDKSDPLDVSQSLVNGAFILRAPDPGKYRLGVDGHLTMPLNQPLEIPATGVNGLNLAVDPLNELTLRLAGADGAPVASGLAQAWASVSWQKGYGDEPADVLVDGSVKNGMLSVPAARGLGDRRVLKVDLWVRVAGAGCVKTALPDWPASPVSLHLQPGAAVTGSVLDAAGKPAAGAVVTASLVGTLWDWVASNFRRFQAVSGPDGHFTVPSLFPGFYEVRVTIPGSGDHYENVNLGSTGTVSVTLSPHSPQWSWQQTRTLDKG